MIFKEDKPIYMQISNRVCEEILTEQYPEQERLPSVREYASMVEVNANTVARAYDYMQSKDIIYNKRGIGYFVNDGARKKIFSIKKDEFVEHDLRNVFKQMDLLGMTIADIDRIYEHYKNNAGSVLGVKQF